MTKRFYILAPTGEFWKARNQGYTDVISEAHKYTEGQAERLVAKNPTNVAFEVGTKIPSPKKIQ